LADDTVLVDTPLTSVRRIRIDRPERSNALTPAICGAIESALASADKDPAVHVVLIGGTGGRSFCGGYDLTMVGRGVRDEALQSMLARLRAMTIPSVAVVDGHAVGAGLDLACSCDLRVVRHGVKIGLPAVRVGVAYDAAGLRHIIAIVPAARRLLLTGELLPVDEVPGFADMTVDAAGPSTAGPDAAAAVLARQLASAAPAGLAYMAAMIRPGASLRYDVETARRWRDQILDGGDADEAARVRGTDEQPRFAPRPVRS
jgi:enoyl-CoA hydratase/carnithine racemase